MFLTKKLTEKMGVTFLNFFLNAMIRNIKIHNFFILLRFQKSMESNKCIQIFLMKMFIKVILMIFQNLLGLGKSRCDIPSGHPRTLPITCNWPINVSNSYKFEHPHK